MWSRLIYLEICFFISLLFPKFACWEHLLRLLCCIRVFTRNCELCLRLFIWGGITRSWCLFNRRRCSHKIVEFWIASAYFNFIVYKIINDWTFLFPNVSQLNSQTFYFLLYFESFFTFIFFRFFYCSKHAQSIPEFFTLRFKLVYLYAVIESRLKMVLWMFLNEIDYLIKVKLWRVSRILSLMF